MKLTQITHFDGINIGYIAWDVICVAPDGSPPVSRQNPGFVMGHIWE